MSRLVGSLQRLLADVHQAVVKLDHGTGGAADGIRCRVISPTAVVVPGAARVIGPHRVVRLVTVRGGRCRWDTAVVGRPRSPHGTTVVRTTRLVTRTRVVGRRGTDSGGRANSRRCTD